MINFYRFFVTCSYICSIKKIIYVIYELIYNLIILIDNKATWANAVKKTPSIVKFILHMMPQKLTGRLPFHYTIVPLK